MGINQVALIYLENTRQSQFLKIKSVVSLLVNERNEHLKLNFFAQNYSFKKKL